jgi:hypothetical protein
MIGRCRILGPRVPLGKKVLPAAILLGFFFFFSVAEMVDGGELSSNIVVFV